METRDCCSCGEEKSISGVWYVMADGTGAFMCGTCFSESRGDDRSAAGASAV